MGAAEHSVGAAVVDVVEEVEGLDAEVQRVLAAGAAAAKHAAGAAASTTTAEAARTEAASGRSAASSSAIRTAATTAGTAALIGRGGTGFRTEAPRTADTEIDGHRRRAGARVGGNARFTRHRLGIHAAEARLGNIASGGVGRALGGCRHSGALVIEVVHRIFGQSDVERLARLRNEEGIEAQTPGAAVVGHGEHLVARDEGGGTIVLAEVVGVGNIASGSAVAVGPTRGVEADQAQVLVDTRIHAGDQLVLLEDAFGIELVDVAARRVQWKGVVAACSQRGIVLVGIDGDQLVGAEGVQVGHGQAGAGVKLAFQSEASLGGVGRMKVGRNVVPDRYRQGTASGSVAGAGAEINFIERCGLVSGGGCRRTERLVEHDLVLSIGMIDGHQIGDLKAIVEVAVSGAQDSLGGLAVAAVERICRRDAGRPIVVVGNVGLGFPAQAAGNGEARIHFPVV